MKSAIPFILLLATQVAASQNIRWAKVINVHSFDNIYDLTTDNRGNLIVCGQFGGTVDFDPGPDTAALTAAGTGGRDIFVAKYDSAGNYRWAFRIGNTFFNDEGDRVTVDTAGNVFVTGFWSGTADFDPDSVATANLTSGSGVRSRFLAKYDPDGHYLAAVKTGNAVGTLPSSQDAQTGLGCDAAGNVYMSGFYGTSLAVGPGTTLPVSGLSDNYFAKFDTALNLVWARRLNSSGTEYSQGMYVHPDGTVLVLGSFGASLDIDPGPGVQTMVPSGSVNDGYFAVFDSAGQLLFGKQLQAGTSASPIAAYIDSGGDIVVTGSCAGTMDADPDTSVATIGAGFNNQAFVAMYDSLGNYRQAFAFGDVGAYQAIRYAGHDTSGNLFAAGNYNPWVDIDPTADTAVFGNRYGAWVASYDTAGALRSGFFMQEAKMTVRGEDIWLTGAFYGLVDVDPGPQAWMLQSDTNNASWYLLRMRLCDAYAPSPGRLGHSSLCPGDTALFTAAAGGAMVHWEFPAGFTPLDTAGDTVAVAVAVNAQPGRVTAYSTGGCQNSPLVYQDIVVNTPLVPVITWSAGNDTLLAQPFFLTYQWFFGDSALSGATDSLYVPLQPGYYSVSATDSNGCTSRSDSLLYLFSSVIEPVGKHVAVFPNPFTDKLEFRAIERDASRRITVLDLAGKVILQQPFRGRSLTLDSDNWASGIYFVRIAGRKATLHFRLDRIRK